MATFEDIQIAVSKRLLDPANVSVSSSDVGSAINEAISYWKFRRFWFNEVFDSVTLTQQVGTIPMSGDILVPSTDDDGFVIEYADTRYPLAKATQQQYDGLWIQNGYGLPRWYARVGQDYEVYPLPDQNYELKRHFLKEYQPLVNGADTNDFTVYASVLIRNWTLADLTAEFRQDDKMETYFRARAEAEVRNLDKMTAKSNGSGKLTLHSNLLY